MSDKDLKLTLKQKRFADEYIISGNAYQSAISAGYSENYAKARIHEMLENVGIKFYIEEKLKELNKSKFLSMEEALSITASIARGEPKEATRINEVGEEERVLLHPTFADRQKALEHFYKIQGAFIEKKEISAEVKALNLFDGISTNDIKKLIKDD